MNSPGGDTFTIYPIIVILLYQNWKRRVSLLDWKFFVYGALEWDHALKSYCLIVILFQGLKTLNTDLLSLKMLGSLFLPCKKRSSQILVANSFNFTSLVDNCTCSMLLSYNWLYLHGIFNEMATSNKIRDHLKESHPRVFWGLKILS